MVWTPCGSAKDVRLVQPEKVAFSILFNLPAVGIVREVIPVQAAKATKPRLTKFVGNVTEVRPVQP